MPTVLSEVLTKEIESLQGFAAEHGLDLESAIPEGIEVDTDPDLTVLVVEGLINMAFKQGCKGDNVKVLACANGRVTVDILVSCHAEAPQVENLEACKALVDPFLKVLSADLDISRPTPQSVLFSMQLPKG